MSNVPPHGFDESGHAILVQLLVVVVNLDQCFAPSEQRQQHLQRPCRFVVCELAMTFCCLLLFVMISTTVHLSCLFFKFSWLKIIPLFDLTLQVWSLLPCLTTFSTTKGGVAVLRDVRVKGKTRKMIVWLTSYGGCVS
jgi:hypothetical protein